MIAWVSLYGVLYFILLIIGLTGLNRHKKKQTNFHENKKIGLDNLTLIIPFRNEENRINQLLQSILQSNQLPNSIIFVDDHSDDNTVKLIESTLTKKVNYTILKSNEKGKKGAIKTGIEKAITSFILTMDADISFDSNYFSEIEKLAAIDMHILPVLMTSNGWHKLFELDVYFVNGLNTIADGLKHPIAASGANLLFKRESYNLYNSYSNHAHILSGDDQFLLADFNRVNLDIQLHSNHSLSALTPVPQTIKELLSQRLRWISKTPLVPDFFAVKIGIIQTVSTVLFLSLVISTLITKEYNLLLIIWFYKSFIDLLLISTYFKNIKKQELLFLTPVYKLILPFYSLLLVILSIFYKPTWKGRK